MLERRFNFFKTNGRRQVNHVGMVVEVNNGDIKFIHASTSNGVIISSIKEKYYSKDQPCALKL
jgi:cell wall-associated NlpC family hydrolase